MSDLIHRIPEIEEDIRKCRVEFFLKYGISPIILYDISSVNKLSLEVLEAVVNNVLRSVPEGLVFVEGIRCKSRDRVLVIHRQCFMKIATDFGYSLSATGRYIGNSHATVIHACKTIDVLLEQNNIQTHKIYNSIKNAISKVELERNLQSDAEVRDYSQSVLSSTCNQGGISNNSDQSTLRITGPDGSGTCQL